jgi:hypothetical protein
MNLMRLAATLALLALLTGCGETETAPTFQWTSTFDGGLSEAAVGVATDPSGNVIVVGNVNDGAHNHIWLRKVDAAGMEVWTRTIAEQDSQSAAAVGTDHFGNVFVAGDLGEEIFLRKYDPAGQPLWTRTDQRAHDNVTDMAVTPSGGAVVVAISYLNGEADMWLSAYGASGEQLWTRVHAQTYGYGVAADDSGDVIAAGASNLSENSLYRYGASGAEKWGSSDGEGGSGRKLTGDGDGNSFIVGTVTTKRDEQVTCQIWAAKFDRAGQRLWTQSYGAAGTNIGMDVTTDPDGNAVVLGTVYRSDNPPNMSVRKYDGGGYLLWADDDQTGSPAGVASDAYGNVFVAGTVNNGTDDDILLVKYDADGGYLP